MAPCIFLQMFFKFKKKDSPLPPFKVSPKVNYNIMTTFQLIKQYDQILHQQKKILTLHIPTHDLKKYSFIMLHWIKEFLKIPSSYA